jgi:cysteinyl-tRNA synthetase
MLAALEDDLNTPEAIAELFGVVRAANRATEAAEKRALAESLRAGAWLLGLLVQDPGAWFKATQISASTAQITLTSHPASVTLAASAEDAEIDSLVQQRDAFRKERNFAEADRIRRQLTERGIVIEDAAGGARWRRSR